MEEIWADLMLNGKVNPASGIFIGKNHFGYRDAIDLVDATPTGPLGDEPDQARIMATYAELPED